MNINSPFIELIGACADFNGEHTIAGISFQVTRGEFVSLHGPTGSGKSLALQMIAGLVTPTSGEVFVAGECINHFSNREKLWLRRSMGIMLQEGLLLDNRTILENVMLPSLAAEHSFRQSRERAQIALKKCHLEEFADAYPTSISQGQRQIACLARAVVNRPVVILADEPAAHLDVENAQALVDLLGEFSLQGVAVIMASHLELSPTSVACRSIQLGIQK